MSLRERENLSFVFIVLFVWASTSVCIYLNHFTYSVFTVHLSFQMVSGSLGLFLPCLSYSFPLVILFVCQMEEEPFNPDYVDVDRVLEVSYCEDKDTGEVK